MSISRRDFLKTGSMGVAMSFLSPGLFTKDMFAAGTPRKVLVVLQLGGGNDSVNTFIPYADARYRTLRPTLAIPDANIVKLDGSMGMHPALGRLKPHWDAGKFTFVSNVGFPTLDRSHFRCTDVWSTADETSTALRNPTGWLGKYADTHLSSGNPSVLTNVAIGGRNPMGIQADQVLPIAISSQASFDVVVDNNADRTPFTDSLRTLYDLPRTQLDPEFIRSQGKDTFEAIDLFKTIPGPSTTVLYPNNGLSNAFKLAAQIIAGNLGTHAIWISTGGYDTHSQQGNAHNNLLSGVADALFNFQADLVARGIADNVLVMAWSEFGRRLQENASQGTDHGKAGTMFLLGNAVKGGAYYGTPPDLSNLPGGDLATEIDFRAVYGTIIKDFFGKDPDPVLGRTYENLGFLQPVVIGCDTKYGDLNEDLRVDTVDSVILSNHLVGNLPQGTAPYTAAPTYADLDESGRVDVADLVILNNHLVGNIPCLPKQ